MLGGTRFVGRAVVDALVLHGHDVTVVHPGLHPHAAGLPDIPHIHASRSELPLLDADAVVDCTAWTARDVEEVLPGLPDVPIVLLSSIDVYAVSGAWERDQAECPLPISEDTPVRSWLYPQRGRRPGRDEYDKLLCEQLYLDRRAVVLRLPWVFGPHDYKRREEFVLRRIRACRRQMPIGAANLLVSRVFVEDVGSAVAMVLEVGVERDLFVLGDGLSATVRQLAEAIIEVAGSPLELVRIADEASLPADLDLTRAHQQHLLTSVARARELLLWTPTPWRDAIRRSVAWHLEHPPAQLEDDFSADEAALSTHR